MNITLQQNCWQGFEPLVISLPDEWDVEYHGIEGDKHIPLSKEEIRNKINAPYNMKPLGELAKGKKKVAIVFDDISRGTPTQPMAEVVIEELHKAEIGKEQIRFICALGTHGAHNRIDFEQKLGEKITSTYRIYNHNPYENCVKIGTTCRGFDVYINKEFMECDLKIGLGAFTPHPFNSFGGGGKILFPGLASIDTIQQNHSTAINYIIDNKLNHVAAMGDLSNDGMRKEVEEMTRMVGEFYKIDCIYNTRLELIDLYAGAPIEEYYAGVTAAQALYKTPKAMDKDIVIVNANAKGNEATIAVAFAAQGVADTGGDIVLIDFSQRGQVTHYLLGAFGTNTGGRMWGKIPKERPNIHRIICYMPYPEMGSDFWFGEPHKQIYVKTWDEVMALLKETHGPGTKVSIIADGTIQYYEQSQ